LFIIVFKANCRYNFVNTCHDILKVNPVARCNLYRTSGKRMLRRALHATPKNQSRRCTHEWLFVPFLHEHFHWVFWLICIKYKPILCLPSTFLPCFLSTHLQVDNPTSSLKSSSLKQVGACCCQRTFNIWHSAWYQANWWRFMHEMSMASILKPTEPENVNFEQTFGYGFYCTVSSLTGAVVACKWCWASPWTNAPR
jgi:hypothetical protein